MHVENIFSQVMTFSLITLNQRLHEEFMSMQNSKTHTLTILIFPILEGISILFSILM